MLLVAISHLLEFGLVYSSFSVFDLLKLFGDDLSCGISFFIEPFEVHNYVLDVALQVGSHLFLLFELFSALIQFFF